MEEKKELKIEKIRARNYNLVLYPDNETHVKALDYIEKNFDYAYILHDKDTNEFGEIKKVHYHVVLRFNNAKWNTALADELGITVNYLEESRNLKRSLLYLIHYYDENKYQYPKSDVKGTLKNRLEEIISNQDKTENEKMQDLISYIDCCETEIHIAQFVRYCVSTGYTDVLRRNLNLLRPLIDEHNDLVKE